MITNPFASFQGDPKQLGPLALAFIGDGVYELLVRGHLMENHNLPTKTLHKLAVQQVNATAQADAYNIIVGQLTAEESDILRRGRNAKVARVPKNSSTEEYHKATAIEALFGYLYLNNEMERILELFNLLTTVNEKID